MRRVVFHCVVLGIAILGARRAIAGETKQHESKLQIAVDASGQIVLTWNGKAELAEARGKSGLFKKLRKSTSPYSVAPTEEVAAYRLETANSDVYSVNAVGYANVQLPPGLSLIAHPFYQTDNDLAKVIPAAPDGSQVYRYNTANGAYEVSTFDAVAHAWSNPACQVPVGTAFLFRNPSQRNFTQTFVGEVLQGCLTNALPDGYSTKGAFVPQSASLSTHQVPGEIGDEVRTYTNDLQGGGSYNISIYTADGWTPDLNLGIGQGFWIYKQNPQDWVRCFWVN